MRATLHQIFLLLFLSCIILGGCKPSKDNKKELATAIASDFHELLDATPSIPVKDQRSVKDGGLYQDFQNPKEVRAINGRLETTLSVEFATHKIYSFPETGLSGETVLIKHRSYNGELYGPVLRIKRGDSLLVTMVNNLPNNTGKSIAPCLNDDCDSLVLNATHEHSNEEDTTRYNVTNLHTHGFHVSPNGHSDNIFAEIYPGWHFQNRYQIPQNHAEGTFWYHAHVHGSTDIQVSSGMAGAIIIEGGLDTLPKIKEMNEKIFLLQQMSYSKNDTNAIKTINTDRVNRTYHTMINGQTTPIIHMQAQEVQRWRFIHAGVRGAVKLNLVSRTFDDKGDSKLHSHLMYPIAEDGIAYGYRDEVYQMELQPGYRADMLIQADVEGKDTLYLIDESTEQLGSISVDSVQEKNQLLAIIIVEDQNTQTVATTLPTSEELAPYAPYQSLANATPTDPYVQKCTFNIDLEKSEFQINGYPFDSDSIILAQKGAIQDWELTSDFVDHPFHIHVNHFQIIEIDGEKLDKPKWKDTYMVDQDKVTKVRTIYKDFTGAFVIHCHILEHEDRGMMHTVAIVDDKQAVLKDKEFWKQWSWCVSKK